MKKKLATRKSLILASCIQERIREPRREVERAGPSFACGLNLELLKAVSPAKSCVPTSGSRRALILLIFEGFFFKRAGRIRVPNPRVFRAGIPWAQPFGDNIRLVGKAEWILEQTVLYDILFAIPQFCPSMNRDLGLADCLEELVIYGTPRCFQDADTAYHLSQLIRHRY